MENVRIETGADITLKDYRGWHFFLYYLNGMTGILNTLGVIAITAISVFIIAHKAMTGDWHFKFAEIAMLVMDVYMLSVPAVIFYDTKENFGSEKFKAENGKLTITPESIEMASENGNARITWDTVGRAYVTRAAIYLEYAKFTAVIIPKRFLKDKQEQELISIIKSKGKIKK